jgi:ankyrin repeat protein
MGGANGKPYSELKENQRHRIAKALFDALESKSSDAKSIKKFLSGGDESECVISGADLDRIRNQDGIPPLFRAVELGRGDLVPILLETGCRPRCCDARLVSALHIAIRNGRKDIVQALLDAGGSDVTLSQDFSGKLPIHYVRQFGIRQ